MKRNSTLTVSDLRDEFELRADAIRARLADFKKISSSEYFYELAYCLLTPQSSAIHADSVVHLLRENDFLHQAFSPESLLRRKDCYIRFHKTKANNLIEAKKQYPIIYQQLTATLQGEQLRLWLVHHVRGLGWKEASHFLRNIGFERLAILDRHVLRNLVRVGVIRGLPKTLTPKRYLAIEKKFFKFAQHIGISMDELDLLFWSIETGTILK